MIYVGSTGPGAGGSPKPASEEVRKHQAVDQLNSLAGLLQPQKVDEQDVFHFNNLFTGEKMFDLEAGTIFYQSISKANIDYF